VRRRGEGLDGDADHAQAEKLSNLNFQIPTITAQGCEPLSGLSLFLEI
jgi:hypothetical protein